MVRYVFLLILGAFFYFVFLLSLVEGSDTLTLVSALDAASVGWLIWAFLILGMLIAMLIGIILPISVRLSYVNYRDRSFIKSAVSKWGYPKEPPSDLSAAAVSVLRGREVTSRTLGTIVIEMCLKGVLRVTPVARTRIDPLESGRGEQYDYWFTVRSRSSLDWERALCDAIQEGEVTSERLKATLEERRDTIGKQLGEYLKARALFDRNPMSGFHWLYCLWRLGIVLLVSSSIAAAYAITVTDFTSTVTVVLLILGLGPICACYTLVWLDYRHLIKLADKRRPNYRGVEELEKWLAFRQSMWQQSPPTEDEERSKSYPFLPYAFALGVDKRWMYSGITETAFSDNTVTVTATNSVIKSDSGSMFRPADGIFVGMIAADYVTGDAGRADTGIGGDIGGDMDLDIDLSI